jgi:hypothetical protein
MKFNVVNFSVYLSKNKNSVEIVQKSRGTSHEGRRVFHVVGGDMFNATVLRTACCVSMETLSIFITLLTATYVRQWERIVGFPCQKSLRERAAILRYIAYFEMYLVLQHLPSPRECNSFR